MPSPPVQFCDGHQREAGRVGRTNTRTLLSLSLVFCVAGAAFFRFNKMFRHRFVFPAACSFPIPSVETNIFRGAHGVFVQFFGVFLTKWQLQRIIFCLTEKDPMLAALLCILILGITCGMRELYLSFCVCRFRRSPAKVDEENQETPFLSISSSRKSARSVWSICVWFVCHPHF